MRDLKNEIYGEFVRDEMELMPGALDLLKELRGKMKIACASSSHTSNIIQVFNRFNLYEFFNVIKGGDMVENIKPHPEMYKTIADESGLLYFNIVVIEDSVKGIIPGKKLGMKTIAVPSEFTKDQNFKGTDLVVNSLSELSYEIIKNLGYEN
ncbi:HAD family hydrolase [Nanoarchaeota archaeon]